MELAGLALAPCLLWKRGQTPSKNAVLIVRAQQQRFLSGGALIKDWREILRPWLVFGNILCHSKHLLLVYCYKLENCFPFSLLGSISSTVSCDGLYLQLEL